MSYRYRCQTCRTTSPPVSLAAAEAERHRHRVEFHGGHVPDGEDVRYVGPQRNEWWTDRRVLRFAAVVLAVIGWLKGYRL
jgi:hypothetical protein